MSNERTVENPKPTTGEDGEQDGPGGDLPALERLLAFGYEAFKAYMPIDEDDDEQSCPKISDEGHGGGMHMLGPDAALHAMLLRDKESAMEILVNLPVDCRAVGVRVSVYVRAYLCVRMSVQ